MGGIRPIGKARLWWQWILLLIHPLAARKSLKFSRQSPVRYRSLRLFRHAITIEFLYPETLDADSPPGNHKSQVFEGFLDANPTSPSREAIGTSRGFSANAGSPNQMYANFSKAPVWASQLVAGTKRIGKMANTRIAIRSIEYPSPISRSQHRFTQKHSWQAFPIKTQAWIWMCTPKQ